MDEKIITERELAGLFDEIAVLQNYKNEENEQVITFLKTELEKIEKLRKEDDKTIKKLGNEINKLKEENKILQAKYDSLKENSHQHGGGKKTRGKKKKKRKRTRSKGKKVC